MSAPPLTPHEAGALTLTLRRQRPRYDWLADARPDQLPPPGDWHTWLLMAGRGAGKTRTGAETTLTEVMAGRRARVALVAPTAADVRDVMVEGESGLLACAARRGWHPTYEPSKRRVRFPNGAVATCYSAEEPNRLRGPQHDWGWYDELAAWDRLDDAWSNLQFGLRLRGPRGDEPRQVATTTPRPVPLVRKLLAAQADGSVVVSRATSYDNLPNLAPTYRRIIHAYEGTRLGRQELLGELLDEVEGALWTHALIEAARLETADLGPKRLTRTVVAIDPAVGDDEGRGETGIVVAARDAAGHAYVLDDRTGRFSPGEWAAVAVQAYDEFAADRVVAETNQGGALVEHTVRTVRPNVAYRGVRASKGKLPRAEPVAALYEQGKVHHVGLFGALEDQMCGYVGDGRQPSPDRMDALVWALTDLVLGSHGLAEAVAPPDLSGRSAWGEGPAGWAPGALGWTDDRIGW